jgi:prepilin-type N-terminal cleavage/methylation domain-containing protein
MLKKLDKRGFTIIEVLIVLAIAGLIMLVIFLAVPTLQRNQRNNARQTDANNVVAAVNDCITNRNGAVASCQALGANAVVAPTNANQLTANPAYSGALALGTTTGATWTFGVTCSADGLTNVAGTARQFVVRYQAETNGGGITPRCISS